MLEVRNAAPRWFDEAINETIKHVKLVASYVDGDISLDPDRGSQIDSLGASPH